MQSRLGSAYLPAPRCLLPTPIPDDRFLIQTAQNVELSIAPAGVGDRALAWLADAVVIVGYVIAVVFALSQLKLADDGLFMVVIGLPLAFYHIAFEVMFEGQTPGKMLLKIRVARLDGAQPTLGQYVLRWLLRLVDVTGTSGLVAVVSISATARQQRLGDIAAGTTVVRQRRRVALDDVLYPEHGAGYVPRFPEAARLSDADIRTLRAVIVRHRLGGRRGADALAERAKIAVEARLGLDAVPMEAAGVLHLVVGDHTFVLDEALEV